MWILLQGFTLLVCFNVSVLMYTYFELQLKYKCDFFGQYLQKNLAYCYFMKWSICKVLVKEILGLKSLKLIILSHKLVTYKLLLMPFEDYITLYILKSSFSSQKTKALRDFQMHCS